MLLPFAFHIVFGIRKANLLSVRLCNNEQRELHPFRWLWEWTVVSENQLKTRIWNGHGLTIRFYHFNRPFQFWRLQLSCWCQNSACFCYFLFQIWTHFFVPTFKAGRNRSLWRDVAIFVHSAGGSVSRNSFDSLWGFALIMPKGLFIPRSCVKILADMLPRGDWGHSCLEISEVFHCLMNVHYVLVGDIRIVIHLFFKFQFPLLNKINLMERNDCAWGHGRWKGLQGSFDKSWHIVILLGRMMAWMTIHRLRKL